MGQRELRPVPLDWEHPRYPGTYADGSPRYRALHSRAFLRYCIRDAEQNGEQWDYDPEDYMPEIPEGTPVGWQLYETTSEGTPVSPVFATLEELAAWCETGATVFADLRWTRQQWLASFKNDTGDSDSFMVAGPSGLAARDPLAR